MKKTTKKGVCLLLLLSCMIGYSQESPDVKKALFTARLQLTEHSKTYNPDGGFAAYQQLALQGNAEAMNALGLSYSKGTGVPVNEQEAINWLEKAAANGYIRAWYNLGLLYRDGIGIAKNREKAMDCFKKAAKGGYNRAWNTWGGLAMKSANTAQDYALAISIFEQGADKDNGACLYSLGYLHYKGFGYSQDYAKAIEFFELSAKKMNPTAMYMLGICYRNGYGVTIDTAKAKYWLNKSASLGSKKSEKELADPEPENTNPAQTKTISTIIPEIITITAPDIPKTFKKVKQAPITKNISGHYIGHLLRFDWSGQNIVSTTSMEVQLNQTDKELTGEWREVAGDTTVFTAKIQEDAILFHDSKIKRTDHFHKNGPVNYDFKEAKLQVLQTQESMFIVGNLQLFNTDENENEKPMYIVLERKQEKASEISEVISSVIIYPNPVLSDFNLSFNLAQTANVNLNLYYLSGVLLYNQKWSDLAEGQHTENITLNAPPGYYLLRMSYGNEVKTVILIKK